MKIKKEIKSNNFVINIVDLLEKEYDWMNQCQDLQNHKEENVDKDVQMKKITEAYDQYQKCHEKWTQIVQTYAFQKKINEVLDNQQYHNKKEKNIVIRETIDRLSTYEDNQNIYQLWGMSLTGTIAHLLKFHTIYSILEKKLSCILSVDKIHVIQMLPQHVSGLLSPQSLYDIVSTTKTSEEIKKVQDYLNFLSISQHIDIQENVGSVQGTAVCLFLSVTKKEKNHPRENAHMFDGQYQWEEIDQLKKEMTEIFKEGDLQLTYTYPEKWSRCVILSGAHALYNNIYQSLEKKEDLNRMNKIMLTYLDKKIECRIYQDQICLSQTELPIENTAWPFSFVIEKFEDMGIRFV